jgi:hypothetical protein
MGKRGTLSRSEDTDGVMDYRATIAGHAERLNALITDAS